MDDCMSGGIRPRAGRRAVKIDLVELEKLASLQFTNEELASFFNVSVRTIENRGKQPKFAEAMARGKSKGKISVRRSEMKLLEAGNATMGIWLGKQLLGQRDVTPIELSGLNGRSSSHFRLLMRSLPKLEKEQEVLRVVEDPVLFAQVMLGHEMWSKQADILHSVAQHSRTAVKACHASGKTFTGARLKRD